MRGRKRTRCKCAPSIMPPTMTHCAGLLYGRRVTRRLPRHGMRKTAPTVFSSRPKVRLICSAARQNSSPILPPGSPGSGSKHALRGRNTRRRLGGRALSPLGFGGLAERRRSRSACGDADRGLATYAANAARAAPARLQNRGRADRPAARALCRALCLGTLRRLDQALGRVENRSCPSSRRRSITACIICSSRSSPRTRSSPAPAG